MADLSAQEGIRILSRGPWPSVSTAPPRIVVDLASAGANLKMIVNVISLDAHGTACRPCKKRSAPQTGRGSREYHEERTSG